MFEELPNHGFEGLSDEEVAYCNIMEIDGTA